MKVDIVGWESEGLRSPDMKIDLMAGDEPAQVALVQMPNGTGKTTTLQMLTATLTGAALRWRPEDIREMRRPADSNERGRFRVDLRADGKPITFELLLNFAEGHAHYRTTTPATGGVIGKWEPPPGVRRFLTAEFIQLFIFDGEFAERLLSQSSNEAERAIDALCQLYLLDEVADFAIKDWEQAVRGGGPTTPTGLTMALNKFSKIKKRIENLSGSEKEAQQKLKETDQKIKELDAGITLHISGKTDLRDQHAQAIEEKVTAHGALESKLAETMRQIRYPNSLHPIFGNALISLKQNLDRLKLPEATSRQFFVELAEEDLCICGRPLDEHSRKEIIVRSKHYLGLEEAGSINALKKDIETYCGEGSDISAQGLTLTTTEMLEAMKAVHLAEQKESNLKRSLIDSGDEELAGMEADRNKLASLMGDLKDLLDTIGGEPVGDEDLDTTHCLKALRVAKKETEAKITKISGTLKHKEQTDMLMEISDRAKKFARMEIRDAIRDECNSMLLKVLGNDPLQIKDIGESLNIQNQSGASVGQTLSVGYTFLMSLLSRGNNQFPLVVDSPCGSLGVGRREAIGGLIPQLCTQFITFIIDVEREAFLPALEKSSKGGIKYFTAFRNTPQTKHLQSALPADGVTQSASATLVEGRDYFINFKE